MRFIQLHSDFIEYNPVSKEIEEAEENISNDKVRLEDLVVILVAVKNGFNLRVEPKLGLIFFLCHSCEHYFNDFGFQLSDMPFDRT